MTAPPLNGPLEVGLRALTLLSVAFPRAFDIGSLAFLDYTLLHSQEFGGPESLHPDVPNHQSEISVKRDLLEHGLQVMMRARLVTLRVGPEGISYAATDDAPGFVNLLDSDYVQALRSRAEWVLGSFAQVSPTAMQALVANVAAAAGPAEGNRASAEGEGE